MAEEVLENPEQKDKKYEPGGLMGLFRKVGEKLAPEEVEQESIVSDEAASLLDSPFESYDFEKEDVVSKDGKFFVPKGEVNGKKVTIPIDPKKDKAIYDILAKEQEFKGRSKEQRHAWLTRSEVDSQEDDTSFFMKSDDDVVRTLKDAYAGFTFEEESFFNSITSGSKRLNQVKITSPDGKNSETIDVGFGGMFDTTKDLKTAIANSRNKLTSFIDKYSDQVNAEDQQEKETQNVAAYNRFNNATKITDEEERTIDEEVNSVRFDAFKTYATELKEAKTQLEELQKEDPKPITMDMVIQRARANLKTEKMSLLKESKGQKYLDVIDDYETSISAKKVKEIDTKGQVEVGAKILRDKEEKKAEELNTKLKASIIDYQEGKTSTDLKTFYKNLEAGSFDIIEGEETVQTKEGVVIPVRVLEKAKNDEVYLNAQYKKINEKNDEYNEAISKIKNVDSQWDNIRRNYDDWEKFGTTIGYGFSDIAVNTAYGMNKLMGGNLDPKSEAIDNMQLNYKKQTSKAREHYQKSIEFENAFSDGNFGKYIAQMTAEQIPIFASLATPGGVGLIFGSTYGEKWSSMVEEERDLGGKPSSTAAKWFKSLGYASAETVFEKYVTLDRVMKPAFKGMMGSTARKQLLDNSMNTYFKANAGNSLLFTPILESGSESLTSMSQNLIDGKPIFENVGEAAFGGGFFGVGFGHVPFYKGLIASKFSDHNTMQTVRDNKKIIDQLAMNNLDLDKKVKLIGNTDSKAKKDLINQINQNNDLIKDFQGRNDEFLLTTEKNINGLKNSALKRYLNLTQQQEGLKNKAESIVNNEGLSDKIKQVLISELQQDFEFMQAQRDAFRNPKSFGSAYAAFQGSRTKADKARQKEIEIKVRQDLASQGNTNPSDNQLFEASRIEFNTQEILNDIKTKKGKTKLGKSFKAFNTVNEAIDAINNMEITMTDGSIDPDAAQVKKDLINEVKNGTHGFNNGTNSFAVVENMAKDDRLETRTHELSHTIATEALGTNPEAFVDINDGIMNYLKESNPAVYNSMLLDLDAYNDNQKPFEVLPIFLEKIADGTIDMKAKKNSKFAVLLGRMLSIGVGKATNSDFDFDFAGADDVVDFMDSLGKKIKAGKVTLKDRKAIKSGLQKLFKGLKKVREEKEGKLRLSRSASQVLLDEDIKTPLDKFVLKEDGTLKYKTQEEFRKSDDYFKAYNLITETPLLNGLINVGMTEQGLTEAALIDFRQKVKEKLGERFLRNYDPAKANGSLFGFIIGGSGNYTESRMYRAKGDVMVDYGKETPTVSSDKGKVTKEGDSMINQFEAEKDVAQTRVEEKDMSVAAQIKERKQEKSGEKVIEEDLGKLFVDTSDRLNIRMPLIDKIIKNADIDIVALSAKGYKGVKELVSGKGAPLKEVLSIVSDMMGIESSRILGKSDLTKKQREDAQDYVDKNAQALLDAFPLGETESGKATGAANTSLGFLYKEGKRVRASEGKGTQGKIEQIKREDADVKELKEAAGILKEGNITNRSIDPILKAIAVQLTTIISNQVIRQQALDAKIHPVKIIALIGDGRSPLMFSKSLRNQVNKNPSIALDIIADIQNIKPSQIEAVNGNIKKLFKVIFNEPIDEKIYDEKVIMGIADDLQKIFDKYKKQSVVNMTTPVPITDIIVDQLIYDSIEDRQYYKTVVQNVTGVTGLQNTNNIDHVANVRTNLMRPLAQRLDKKFGKGFSERFLVPGTAAPSKVGAGQYQFTSLTKYNKTKGWTPRKKNGKKQDNRKGLVNNVEDARIVYGTTKGDIGKFKAIPSDYMNGNLTELPSKQKQILFAEVQNENNDAFRKVILELKDMYDSGLINENEVVTFLETLNANQKGLTRASAVLDFVPEGKFDDNLVLEHMTPALAVNLIALNHIISKSNETSKDFTDVMDNYRLAYLPKKYDTIVNRFYKSTMPVYWKPSLPSIVRYYNSEMYGLFDLKLKQISTGQVIGKGFISDKKAWNKFQKNAKTALTAKQQRAINLSKSSKQKPKGITVLDFDDTLATTKSMIRYTMPDGTKGKLNAEQYAATYEDLLGKGYVFDFSEFSKVVKGKTAPLFNKALKLQAKFGSKNMFILTARPADSAPAIQAFLKANGLNIPLQNITGLANSTSEAKALWMADKVGEGYNDFYFADDALQNVQAVKNILDQFDVKSKVQQAKINFSKGDYNERFNEIIEINKGVKREAIFSDAVARAKGAEKNRFRLYIPPGAEDFMGLMYTIASGRGKVGEKQVEFFNEAILKPYQQGIREINSAKQKVTDSYRNLLKQFPDVKKKLKEKVPGTSFTYDAAIRIHLWTNAGFEIPGLTARDSKTLLETVRKDQELSMFAETLSQISNRPEGYTKPDVDWVAESIVADLDNATNKIGRAEFLTDFKENVEIIFSKNNLNKIQAIYGSDYRDALENMLYRMTTGQNRSTGTTDAQVNRWTTWITNSVGAIMFLNMRSALLQTISAVNFVNWDDNNPVRAAVAFAKQKQYWSDFVMIFNSDFLRQRRSGLKTDVNEAQLANALTGKKNKAKAALAYMLKLGFTPTQIADSFAIASGGATFYRNRLESYLYDYRDNLFDYKNEGEAFTDEEIKIAEDKAFADMQDVANVSQQSSDPSLISRQQASILGRFILAFQNTPMQYARIIKKSAIDLIKGRGDWKSNVSKIVYYGAIQNLIFSAMQSAMFALMFDDDEDEKDQEKADQKRERLVNTMIDSLLRGTGIYGAVVATAKNIAIEFYKQDQQGYKADHAYTLLQFANISPPIGSKMRKIYGSTQTRKFNKDVMKEMGVSFNNPLVPAVGTAVEGFTNLPLGRAIQKVNNLQAAVNEENENWQRLALMMGWSTWDLGVENTEAKKVRKQIKLNKKSNKTKSKTKSKSKTKTK